MDNFETTNGASETIPGQDTPSITIVPDFAATFTFASHQNSIPVIRSIRLDNTTSDSIENSRLELTASPPFLRSKTWNIDRIVAGESLVLTDRRIDLDASYLAGLNEAERGDITLRLMLGDKIISEAVVQVRLLARDEWGGVADMAQLLPAFSMPNDPAIFKLLRSAAERLTEHGHSSALDGYQSNDPKRAYMLAAAAYSAVAGLGLHYAQPPASFESRGQKVRRPSTMANDILATCLDTTLLFAAALEAAGLNSVVLLLDGHAFAGVWLVKRTLPKTIEPDIVEIRKAIAARELVVFETTGVTHRPAMTFEQARKFGESKVDENATQPFVAAIDIARSRSAGIMPLASHDAAQPDEQFASNDLADIPLPAEPDFLMPADIAEQKPSTAAGRIERWQTKLLDLSLRNRLLNFTDSKKAVSFVCPDIAFLEDRLADNAGIKLISLPEQNPLGERDAAMHREKRGQDIHREFAAQALQRDELSSMLDPKELEARLIALYRQAKSDMTEGGTNTLYLATGVIKWKKKPTDERTYRAPILLLPVKLERSSASARFRLKFHEDEPRLNATLLQFAKRDFDLNLPEFRNGLPTDGVGIDVHQVIETFRHAVRDTPGFEVSDDVALSTFSFAKYLMWKDLTDRAASLKQNRVVKHLIDNPEHAFEGASEPFPDETDIDRNFASADIVMPLPADSSQIAASIAATQGRDFVIIGPPGTGKSQTIANMIASCLAAKKTVLFVAEKTAALDVVYRRLREHGLGDHCLELHSNKADRKQFFAQLKCSWDKRGASTASQWIKLNDQLQVRRDELNAYVDALHRAAINGLTPYSAMGIAAAGRDTHSPDLRWPGSDAHDTRSYTDLETIAAQLGFTFAAVKVRPVLQMIDVQDWSGAWQEKLIAAARSLKHAVIESKAALAALSPRFGLEGVSDLGLFGLQHFADVAHNLIATAGTDQTIILHKDFPALTRAIDELENAIAFYRETAPKLSQNYAPDDVSRIPVDDLDREWREANAAIWPKSWFASRRVARLLGSYANVKRADPATDLPLLRSLQATQRAIAHSAVSGTPLAFKGLGTDCLALKQHLHVAEQLRTSLVQLGEFAGNVQAVAASIAAGLRGQVNRPQIAAATDYLAKYRTLIDAIGEFEAVAGQQLPERDAEDFLGKLAQRMEDLEQSRNLFRDWSSWCAIRARALGVGLAPLVADLQTGAIDSDDTLQAFRLGYARWWLPLVIDERPELRNFRTFTHEQAILDFSRIDDLVRKHATDRIVSSLAHSLPVADAVPKNSELGRLRHQIGLQKPSSSIRDMIAAMPGSFSKLAPCVLMSPLSIAQYLPTEQALFDVVIFDEASQIATWDAVGAIARGRQTIIVGDPKQLPPTNFFGRSDDADDGAPLHEKDLESILDEASASGLPARYLRWHYRSRSESLIAFSNWHYYDNKLITFPGPVTHDQAVSLAYVPTGIYDRGKSRTNLEEARAIVSDIRRRLENWLLMPEAARPTLGVITFNAQQQSLILDLLDEARRENPDFEWFFSEDRVEPLIVKNLENIQGDERDVILFSITFSRDMAGKLTMDFGAINKDGGERRLNVAVTRARRELRVFSGLRADDIDLTRSKAVGVAHLKAFLDYAVRGAVALPAQDSGLQGEFESPFEMAVAAELERRGWQVVPQVGVSGYRIDLGVRHPDHAGSYLAGIECDGATYHSSATARDRDKVREQVLTGLGWTILRVWSTDWWFNAAEAIERLHDTLNAALEKSRVAAAEAARTSASQTTDVPPTGLAEDVASTTAGEVTDNIKTERQDNSDVQTQDPRDTPVQAGATLIASAATYSLESSSGRFAPADLSAFKADPDLFFEFSYRPTIQAMVDAVMEAEAPIKDDMLAQRVARAHGWLRTGARIRDQIARHLRSLEQTHETTGAFLWKPGTVAPRVPFRMSADPDQRRSIADISIAELADLVLTHPTAMDEDDPPLVYARLMQVDRLAATSRERLMEAIAHAKTLIT